MLPSARVVSLDADQSGVARPDHTTPGQQLWLERGPDHRSAYLNESDVPRELSGGRGTVHMVATGTWASDGRIVTLVWDGEAAAHTWALKWEYERLVLQRLT